MKCSTSEMHGAFFAEGLLRLAGCGSGASKEGVCLICKTASELARRKLPTKRCCLAGPERHEIGGAFRLRGGSERSDCATGQRKSWGFRADRADLGHEAWICSGLSMAQAREPKPPASATAIARSAKAAPAMGAWRIGSSIPKRSCKRWSGARGMVSYKVSCSELTMSPRSSMRLK